jgi:hypothetical protein
MSAPFNFFCHSEPSEELMYEEPMYDVKMHRSFAG